jgi:pyridoxal 5'-phosphate synthase pdxT subunit
VKAGVLALQGAFREHREVLDALGVETVEVRVPEDLGALDAVVLPGGESTTMGKLLDTSGLRGPLEERLQEGLAVLGTCAGMILLAREVVDGRLDQQPFGLVDVTVRRNAYGRQRDSFEADLDIAVLPGGSFRGVFIRAPRIEATGPAVEVLAVHDGHPVLARQGHAWVASFHPELSGDLRLHQRFLEEVATS